MPTLAFQPLFYWAVAVAATFALASHEARKRGLDAWTMYVSALAALAGAMIAAPLYGSALAALAGQPDSGSGALGAFAGAALAGSAVLHRRRVAIVDYADAAVGAVLFGYAVFRLGCFANGCCHGIESSLPWAVAAHPGQAAFEGQVARGLIAVDAVRSLPVHPTQLYHTAAALFAFVMVTRSSGAWPGQRLALALLIYGCTRFAIEFLRGDRAAEGGWLDINQWGAIAMVGLAVVLRQRAASSRGQLARADTGRRPQGA
jgi:phosphatidylglycerol:prolipoprotein diacylglycerol transferase